MIEVRGLVKAFGVKPVLRGLDFQVAEGEFVAVVGPNGAGKTTLLRILTSMARPTMGEVRIAGLQLPRQSGAARKILGVVSHQPLLYGDLTADQNLRFFGRMYGVSNLDDRISEVLSIVRMSARRYDLVRDYSRGMQQRLAIGRGILHRPELLLFDEPHTGLDPDAADMLDDLLIRVADEGRTVVMTSHDLTRAGELASRVDILSGGKIARSIKRGELDRGELNQLYYEVTRG
ncbi:MAG: ABC transporter ATP-binding protein [Chloroflexi bacterium]|nr:ABC transporter ATP-binding protein [Chloroflexota bacterium]